MRKIIFSLWVICAITIGCTNSNCLKSSVNMQFYLVDRETKQEFLLIDISDNEFKVFEYDASPEKGQIQKVVPVMENGKQKQVTNNMDEYYNSLFLLLREGISLGGEKSMGLANFRADYS